MDQNTKDYLDIVYDEKVKPKTGYPFELAANLVVRFALKPGMSLLDVGCGRGEMLDAFSAQGIDSQGIDISNSVCDDNRIRRCNIAAERFPYENVSFDVVFSKSVIEHLVDPGNMLQEISRVLRPKGLFVILTPDWRKLYRVFFEDPTHVHPYVPKSIHALLRMHGFEHVDANIFCHHKLIWESYLFRNIASIMQAFITVESARWLAEVSGLKFFRWAVERQVLACGYKEI